MKLQLVVERVCWEWDSTLQSGEIWLVDPDLVSQAQADKGGRRKHLTQWRANSWLRMLLRETLAAPKPPGLHTTAREPKRAHFRAPAFKNTKIQRKRRKKENCGGRGKKKTFGPSTLRTDSKAQLDINSPMIFLHSCTLFLLWKDQTRSPRAIQQFLCLNFSSISHARLPTQRTYFNFYLQSLQLAVLSARSELSAIQQSSLLNCALCPQSSC